MIAAIEPCLSKPYLFNTGGDAALATGPSERAQEKLGKPLTLALSGLTWSNRKTDNPRHIVEVMLGPQGK